MTHLPETIYVIRKGDMVIRPKYDEYQQTNGTEIIRLIKPEKKVHLKYRELSKDHVSFMAIIILVKSRNESYYWNF